MTEVPTVVVILAPDSLRSPEFDDPSDAQ